MRIISSKYIKELDEATCAAQGIDSLALMERAAQAVAAEVSALFLPSRRLVVIAGPGDNGGDALAVARILSERGFDNIEVYLFNVTGQLSDNCIHQRDKLKELPGIAFHEITTSFSPPVLDQATVVIDGLFGAGLNRPLTGGFAAVVNLVNESGAYVISIDIPSGLAGEWNTQARYRDMIHANLTLTFQFPKLSFFFAEHADILGEWKVLNINLDPKALKDNRYSDWILLEKRTVRPHLHRRAPFTAKRDYGSAMVFAGSMGMMGAAVMCGKACLKTGAGLATVHTARTGMTILQTSVPEAMFEPDRNERFISDMTLHHSHDAVAVGPGIGTNEATVSALESLLKVCRSPLVLDADALNCIVKRPSMLSLLPAHTVITPHVGEFDRLFGEQPSSEVRLQKAIEMAKLYNIVIVLKSHHTMIVRPTGKVYFNSTGNPGMATAGSGDVLTGVIAGLMAQGYKPEYAATFGVFIHGLAGDLAAEEIGEYGVVASDISDRIGRAIKEIINHKD